MKLRPYQQEAVDNAFAAWARGERSSLLVCATGGGKSLAFSEVIRRHLARGGKRALVLADRSWLVEQARDNVIDHGCFAEIEMAEQRVNRSNPPAVVCASVQSIVRRLKDFDQETFDLVIIDEADLALAPSYRKILDYFPKARVFGVTATPERADGLALGELFESVCLDVDIRDLIDAGYLANVRQWPVKVLDLSRLKMGPDGPDEASLERILLEERHLHEVVKPTLELSGDRPTLVFAKSIAHATALAALFNRYRPGSARSVSGKTKRQTQREILADFVAKRFQFLCNCNLVMRGVDVPPIACVTMARPTQSRTVYIQGLGRGTRLSPETDKKDLLVLDFTDGADNFSLVSAVDVLGGKSTAEERERAREILDEKPGASVTETLDQAKEELEADAAMRKRVQAKVKYRTRELAIRDPIDWKALPLGKESDEVIAERIGTTAATVECARHRLGVKMERKEKAA